jgi:hypothetical protein
VGADDAGSPTPLARLSAPLSALVFISSVLYCHAMVDLLDVPNLSKHDIMRIAGVPGVMLSLAILSLVVGEFVRVLRPEGELEKLAAPGGRPALIRREALARIASFRRVVLAFQLPVAALGLLFAIGGLGFIAAYMYSRWWAMGIMIFCLGGWLLSTGMFILDFLFAMQVAAAVVTDAIEDVIAAALSLSPQSDEWEAKVVQPALALPRGAMTLLSDGWSKGLSIVYVGCWSLAIAVFAAALSVANGSAKAGTNPTMNALRVVVVIVIDIMILLLPLQMSQCVTLVSSSCDELMNTLNERRLDNLGDSERLLALELALKNLHNEQGLGFILTDKTVLDRRMLRNLFFTVASIYATLAPIILSISLTTTDALTAAMYGALPGNSTTVYALSNHHRSYEESVEFCRSIWMQPASIGNQAENDALVRMIYKVGLNYGENFATLDAVFLGARRSSGGSSSSSSSSATEGGCATWPESCEAATHWEWEDGAEMSWFHSGFNDDQCNLNGSCGTEDAQDAVAQDRLTLGVSTTRCDADDERCQLENPRYAVGMVEALGSWTVVPPNVRRGIICEASSMEEIKGATPVVYNLE